MGSQFAAAVGGKRWDKRGHLRHRQVQMKTMHMERTKTTASRSYATGEHSAFNKVLRQYRDPWDEQETVSNPTRNALCQQGLPILFANAGHHQAKDHQQIPSNDECLEVSGVIKRT